MTQLLSPRPPEPTHTRKTTKHVMWCGLSSRGLMHQFFFAVNAKGKTCFSRLQNNTVPPTNNLFLEKECYFQDGMVHHLFITVTQQVFLTTIFLEVGLGTGKGQAMHPSQSPIDLYLRGILKHAVYP